VNREVHGGTPRPTGAIMQREKVKYFINLQDISLSFGMCVNHKYRGVFIHYFGLQLF
jgi:hypothetical protein